MSSAPIHLSESALAFAEEKARREGTSVDDWISQDLEHRRMVEQQTEAFFQERRARAVPSASTTPRAQLNSTPVSEDESE